MDAVTSKLEAMVLTNPDRNTTSGKKQAGCLCYRRNRAKKAKYNAEYYKKQQYSINRNKAVKRGNSRKQKLRGTIVQKWNIKWDPDTVNVGYNDCTCHHSIGPYIQMSLIGNNDIWHSECHYKQMCLSMLQSLVISRENRCSWLFLVLLCLYTYSLLSRQSYKPLPTMAPMQH